MNKLTCNILLTAGMILLVAAPGCKVQRSNQIQTNSLIDTFYPIELGNVNNSFSIHKTFFLGHRVSRFRLKVNFRNPERVTNMAWVNFVTLRIIAQHDTLDFRGNPGPFFTRELMGNLVSVHLFSNSRVDFQGGKPIFEILQVERFFRTDIARNDVPGITATDRVCPLPLSQDVIGVSAGVSEAQHYYLPLRSSQPGIISLYISPRLASLQNATGIRVHLSDTGYVAPGANVAWHEPAPDDSGIYTEFNATQDKFVTVVSTVICPYLIRATRLVDWFDNIVIERDEHMHAPPATDIIAVIDTLRKKAGKENPFNMQIIDYLQPTGDYDRRIRETLTIASAFSLDGTDGQMRFRSAHLYRSIDFFRNADIQFAICDRRTNPTCRAAASYYSINMYDSSLNDPLTGGRTLNHEWGHWQYSLPDEYIDVSGTGRLFAAVVIDPNCLMGTADWRDLCFPRNHQWAPNAEGEEESCWTQIEDQYQGRLRVHTVAFATPSHARYLDVLHQLQALLNLRVY